MDKCLGYYSGVSNRHILEAFEVQFFLCGIFDFEFIHLLMEKIEHPGATKRCATCALSIFNSIKMNTLLGSILQQEFAKQACLKEMGTQTAVEEDSSKGSKGSKGSPFPPCERLGWFENFLRVAFKRVPVDSSRWASIAAIWNKVTGRRDFSNFVLGSIASNRVLVDTFAAILWHQRANEDFLLDGLDSICPVDFWFHLVARLDSVPLWRAIRQQYHTYEKITGNLFVSLLTHDAVAYYVEQHYPEEASGFVGASSDNPFVLATYNFSTEAEGPPPHTS